MPTTLQCALEGSECSSSEECCFTSSYMYSLAGSSSGDLPSTLMALCITGRCGVRSGGLWT